MIFFVFIIRIIAHCVVHKIPDEIKGSAYWQTPRAGNNQKMLLETWSDSLKGKLREGHAHICNHYYSTGIVNSVYGRKTYDNKGFAKNRGDRNRVSTFIYKFIFS